MLMQCTSTFQKPLTNVTMESFCTRSKSLGSKENWENGSKTFSRVENRIRSEWSKIVSGIPQGSVLGPILFLIYISDIGEDLSAKALVYVDDTKIKQRVNNEEDVENLQKELEKLDEWANENNMKFNGKKFQVVRYGRNEELKNNTEYFSGAYEEIIERFETIRDLGVQLSDDASFNEQIEKVCKKARQKSGWIF